MPIEGANLRSMPFEDAVHLVARLENISVDIARQIVAAELDLPFDDVIEPGTLPPIELKHSGDGQSPLTGSPPDSR